MIKALSKLRQAASSTLKQTPPSSSRLASTSTSSVPSTPPTPPSSSSSSSDKTHYLITLLRSPLHLPSPLLATCKSLGLDKRLSSSIVPITRENAGYILAIKELVGVRTVAVDEIVKGVSQEWREREGEGRKGSGLVARGSGGVIRVGTERARGDERGFRLVR